MNIQENTYIHTVGKAQRIFCRHLLFWLANYCCAHTVGPPMHGGSESSFKVRFDAAVCSQNMHPCVRNDT